MSSSQLEANEALDGQVVTVCDMHDSCEMQASKKDIW